MSKHITAMLLIEDAKYVASEARHTVNTDVFKSELRERLLVAVQDWLDDEIASINASYEDSES